MRIVHWNCGMGYHKKQNLVMKLESDFIAVSEVSKKDIDQIQAPFKHWVGSNLNKGLGVIGFQGEYKISELYDDDIHWAIPVIGKEVNVLAIWTHRKDHTEGNYIEVAKRAVNHYEGLLNDKPTIIVGDFNNNAIWDKTAPPEHLWVDFVRTIETKGSLSLYHHFYSENFGEESRPTYFYQWNKEKPFHIDYVFVPKKLAPKAEIVVGQQEKWLAHSDHMPLVTDLVL